MTEKRYNLIAVLDTIEDKLIQQSLELIAFAESFLSGDLSDTLLVVPGVSVTKLCESISGKYGLDTAALEHDGFTYPDPELLSHLLYGVIEEYKPVTVIFTHTVRNCQTAAKLSAAFKASSITGVESFSVNNDGNLFQRSVFNGKLKVNVRPRKPLKILTVLPGAYTLSEDSIVSERKPSVIKLEAGAAPAPASADSVHRTEGGKRFDIKKYKPLSLFSETESGIKLEDADVIVSAGRGIGKEENLELIRETAAIFANSAIGASRPICDQRWIPFNQQVGITGKTVSPKLYMACGISGSQQHIAGMKNSQCIVAVNKDSNAAIFSISDYIIIEDIGSFLPVLVKKYKERYGE